MQIVTIAPNGRVERREHTGYDALSDAVGGYIEAICLYSGQGNAVMYCNEDGKAMNLAPNMMATYLAHCYAGISEWDAVCGTVAIVGWPDDEGNDTDPPEWIKNIGEQG